MQQVGFQKVSFFISWLKRFCLYLIPFLVFLSNISCSAPKKNLLIEQEDREIVDVFLRYVGISEMGVYTILGSKPVTQFHIPPLQSATKLREQYADMPEGFRKKVSFKKFNNSKDVKKLHEICNKWRKIQKKYIGEHFSLHFEEAMRWGYLVNIPHATYILRKYYKDFSQILGIEFDPRVASGEIGNDASPFWKIFKKNSNPFLMGLLFGFGEKNSKFFQWEQEKSLAFPFRVPSQNSLWLKRKRVFGCSLKEKIEHLDIPRFIVYQPVDTMVGKYLDEKEKIIEIYKKRDFAETTVSFLKGEAIPYLSKKNRFKRA